MKVAELEGAALDAAVARALGYEVLRPAPGGRAGLLVQDGPAGLMFLDSSRAFSPSTDWSLAGPIIAGHQIRLTVDDSGGWWAEIRLFDDGRPAFQTAYDRAAIGRGRTPLIAAMRAYVASVFGEEPPDA